MDPFHLFYGFIVSQFMESVNKFLRILTFSTNQFSMQLEYSIRSNYECIISQFTITVNRKIQQNCICSVSENILFFLLTKQSNYDIILAVQSQEIIYYCLYYITFLQGVALNDHYRQILSKLVQASSFRPCRRRFVGWWVEKSDKPNREGR